MIACEECAQRSRRPLPLRMDSVWLLVAHRFSPMSRSTCRTALAAFSRREVALAAMDRQKKALFVSFSIEELNVDDDQ